MSNKIVRTYALLTVVIVGIISAGAIGCNAIISSIDDTEEPAQDNPSDPNNPDAEAPRAIITSHDSGVINEVTEHSPVISWEPDESGITVGVEYQYRFAYPGQNISDLPWIPDTWTEETSVTALFLDESFNPESQVYTFQVRARAIENTSKIQSNPTGLSFFVNAVADQGIVFNRRVLSPNSNFSTEITLDEIEPEDNLAAVQVDIAYNSNRFTVDTSMVDIYTSQGFFTQSGGQIIGLTKIAESDSAGVLSLTIGFVNSGAGLFPISGTGPIATVQFQPLDADPFQEVIKIQTSSRFKTADGSDLLISAEDLDQAVLFRN